jgi:hypothetical protein
LLHIVQKPFANTLAFSEVHLPQSSKRLDLVLYCRECSRPIVVLELKGNFFSQTNYIRTEQRKARDTLRAAYKDDRFSHAQMFIVHFIVKLGALRPSRTIDDLNRLGSKVRYKRFGCGVAPARIATLQPPEGLARRSLLSIETIGAGSKRRAGTKNSAFVQLMTWFIPFSRPGRA